MRDADLRKRRWLRVWTVVAAMVACASLVFLHLGIVGFLLLVGCAAGGSVSAGLLPRDRGASREVLRARWHFVLRWSLRTALWLEAVAALGYLSGYLALLVVAAAALTSPYAVRRWRRQSSPTPVDSPTAALEASDDRLLVRAAASVRGLDLAGLCWAWRRSYLALADVRAPKARLGLVILRQIYLDEMERRDPQGFRAWLDSGVEAAGTPDRFLSSDRPGEQDAA